MPIQPKIYSFSNEADVQSACTTYSLQPTDLHELLTRATTAKSAAYCPYSSFHVGCSILTTSGSYIDGANVENASYPVGTCAERVAFGKAVTLPNWKGRDAAGFGFKAIAVATDGDAPASPCGMCRQFVREFCELNMPILMFDKENRFCVMRLEELLPLSFGPENLLGPKKS